MKKTIYLIAALATVFLASCSNDEQPQGGSAYPIRFTSNVTTPETRATGDYTTYVAGNVFYVWADMTDEGESDPAQRVKEYIPAWKLTVNSTDNTQFDYDGTRTFPVYNKLSFYALHGNFSNTILSGTTPWLSTFNHSVLTRQQTDGEYQLSDLVYARKVDVTPQADAVPLVFQHLLSKIEVSLKPGNGLTEDQMKNVADTKVTVSIVGTKTKVTFSPVKSYDPTLLANRELMVTAVDDTEDDILMSLVISDDYTTTAAAIVVPQTVDGQLIKVSYQNHDTYYSVSNLTLLSGYRYRFNLQVDRIGTNYTLSQAAANTIETWGTNQKTPMDLDTFVSEEER